MARRRSMEDQVGPDETVTDDLDLDDQDLDEDLDDEDLAGQELSDEPNDDLLEEDEAEDDDAEEIDEDDEESLDELLTGQKGRQRVPTVPGVAGDQDNEEALLALVASDDDPIEGELRTKVVPIKDRQEFVCARCHLVKARIQLADPQRHLCRDCV